MNRIATIETALKAAYHDTFQNSDAMARAVVKATGVEPSTDLFFEIEKIIWRHGEHGTPVWRKVAEEVDGILPAQTGEAKPEEAKPAYLETSYMDLVNPPAQPDATKPEEQKQADAGRKDLLQRGSLSFCPFCGSQPYFELGKRGSCQLHGEPFQSVVIRCKKNECPAKPTIQAGDIFNGGETKARREAAKKWNTRAQQLLDLRAVREALEARKASVIKYGASGRYEYASAINYALALLPAPQAAPDHIPDAGKMAAQPDRAEVVDDDPGGWNAREEQLESIAALSAMPTRDDVKMASSAPGPEGQPIARALGRFAEEVREIIADSLAPTRADGGLVEELAAALEWYASPNNWKLEIGYKEGKPECVLPNAYFTDKGERARTALGRYKAQQAAPAFDDDDGKPPELFAHLYDERGKPKERGEK